MCLCHRYYDNPAMFQRTITGACAVLFDENCCDTGDTNFVIPRGGKGEQTSRCS